MLPEAGGDRCVYLAGPWGSLLTELAAQRHKPLRLLVGPRARKGRATVPRFSCGRLLAAADTGPPKLDFGPWSLSGRECLTCCAAMRLLTWGLPRRCMHIGL